MKRNRKSFHLRNVEHFWICIRAIWRRNTKRETRQSVCITMVISGVKLDFVGVCREYPCPSLKSGSNYKGGIPFLGPNITVRSL